MDRSQSTVLIVDDNPSIRWILSESLGHAGYTVIEVGSANAALQELDRNTIDLVISDIDMPDGNGFYLLSEIKKRVKEMPPFFFLSGNTEVTQDQIVALGAQGLLHKPIPSDELLHRIQR